MMISNEEENRYLELQLIALDFAREGNTNELKKMLDHGLSVNLVTLKEDSLLMLASYNGNFDTTKMLIEKGANIDLVNQRGQTPLEGVCFKGNIDLVELLVDSGANFEGKAIIYASMFGHKDIVKYLQSKSNGNKSLKNIGLNILTTIVVKFKNFLKSIQRIK